METKQHVFCLSCGIRSCLFFFIVFLGFVVVFCPCVFPESGILFEYYGLSIHLTMSFLSQKNKLPSKPSRTVDVQRSFKACECKGSSK